MWLPHIDRLPLSHFQFRLKFVPITISLDEIVSDWLLRKAVHVASPQSGNYNNIDNGQSTFLEIQFLWLSPNSWNGALREILRQTVRGVKCLIL